MEIILDQDYARQAGMAIFNSMRAPVGDQKKDDSRVQKFGYYYQYIKLS